MIRAVADTNILVSAFISKGNEHQFLKHAKAGNFEHITSIQILKEFKEVIARPKFRLSSWQINDAIKKLIGISEIIMTVTKLHFIKEDPDDDKILEAAVDGNADFIISGDRHLLKIPEYRGIRIVRTAEFLQILQNEAKK